MTSDALPSDALRDEIRGAVAQRGASAVARELGISRGGLLAYLTGTCQAGTEALVTQRAPAMAGIATRTSEERSPAIPSRSGARASRSAVSVRGDVDAVLVRRGTHTTGRGR